MNSRVELQRRGDGPEIVMDLASRIARLEHRQKLHRIGVGALITAAAGFACLSGQGITPDQTIRAQSFVLEDREGRTRGQIEVIEDAATLSLLDKNGVKRMVLVVEDDGVPSIWLHNEKQNGQAQIALAGGKYPFIEFWGPSDSGPTLSLGVTGRGEAYLHVYDKKQKRYWSAP